MILVNNFSPTMKFRNNNIAIELNIHGEKEYTKVSYPAKYGIFSKLETRDHIFEFNLNHEIKHAKAKNSTWRNPSEWLKRSIGNDWIYYSTGGYSGVFEAIGEYYLPNLMYQTNSLLGGRPFNEEPIDHIVKKWHETLLSLPSKEIPDDFLPWIQAIQQQTPEKLKNKAQKLFDITGSRVSVMPPDARHVDYNIIPLNISDGCLYKCRFCKIKNHKKFKVRSQQNIDNQLEQLKQVFNNDVINFNALFLGEHDALNAPEDLILETMLKAYHSLNLRTSYMAGSYLFLFGSVDSFLNKTDTFFSKLNQLNFQTFINIGLESYDQATLDLIGKPITKKMVGQAFKKIQDINNCFSNIEVTCNFIMDESLPDSHHESLLALIQESTSKKKPKGCVYLSPLKFGSPSREVLYDFYKLKAKSRFPTFLYIIQRL
ncbi:MAG: radical SAM protein [Desulfobacula sp.]|nr:radical SAM protein [Desulfobacula sp.]